MITSWFLNLGTTALTGLATSIQSTWTQIDTTDLHLGLMQNFFQTLGLGQIGFSVTLLINLVITIATLIVLIRLTLFIIKIIRG